MNLRNGLQNDSSDWQISSAGKTKLKLQTQSTKFLLSKEQQYGPSMRPLPRNLRAGQAFGSDLRRKRRLQRWAPSRFQLQHRLLLVYKSPSP
jgi:hypothetical protein